MTSRFRRLAGITLVALTLYGAGAVTATAVIVCHGVGIANRLYDVATWLANAAEGARYEIAVEPTLSLATEPVRAPARKGR